MKSIEWATGLFEGEGYIFIEKDKRTRKDGTPCLDTYCVGIEMTDKDSIEAFAEVFPGGSHNVRQRGEYKTLYTYRIRKKELVHKTLNKMLPHLMSRRAHKALDILDAIECT